MEMKRNLPPLIDSDLEGELHLVLSGASVTPCLDPHLSLAVTGVWYGDPEAFVCRIVSAQESGKISFGVVCDGPAFRQYLLDAKRLVLTLHTIETQECNAVDNDEFLLTNSQATKVLEPLQFDKNASVNHVLKPVNLSPSKRQQKQSPTKRPTGRSVSTVTAAADLPNYLHGTPRHRLLEKRRTSWQPGEEVGQVVVANLKLNSRGELVRTCDIINLFGDHRGTLDVTMVYYENILQSYTLLDEVTNLKSGVVQQWDRNSSYNYSPTENKENECDGLREAKLTKVSQTHVLDDLTEVSSIGRDFGSDEKELLHNERPASENEPDKCHSSNVSLTDESVLDYLRQLDPKALVECGALRQADLPKFLKLIQDCTIDDNASLASNACAPASGPELIVNPDIKDYDSPIHGKNVDDCNIPETVSSDVEKTKSRHNLNGSLRERNTSKLYLNQVAQSADAHVSEKENVYCSEPSVISLPSGVWPLEDCNVFSAPFRGGEKSVSSDRERCKADKFHAITSEYGGENVSSNMPGQSLVNPRMDEGEICYLQQGKSLDLLSKLKYKAFTPEGEEVVMDGRSIARLTKNLSYSINGDQSAQNNNDVAYNSRGSEFPSHEIAGTPGVSGNRLKFRALEKQHLDFPAAVKTVETNSRNYPILINSSDVIASAGERPTLSNICDNSDNKSDISAASDETYTTSTLNNINDSSERASPGSVLLVEVKELTLRGALSRQPTSAASCLKGVKKRSSVCILTSLTVTAPASPHPAGGEDLSLGGRDELMTDDGPTVTDDGRQTITLASRHLEYNKVRYDAVQAFGLAGLWDPGQLQKVSLHIKVYRRVLGQQKSEELCGAELSLWDVYRLVHGHLIVPLAPAYLHHSPSRSLRFPSPSSARCGPGISRAFPDSTSRQDPSRRISGGEKISVKSPKKKRVADENINLVSKRLISGNVRSTKSDRDVPKVGGLAHQGRGSNVARSNKCSKNKLPGNGSAVSGEICIFLKLFLNEQYGNELRNSIIEDPLVLASFAKREALNNKEFEDSDESDVVTVLPNLDRHGTTRLLDQVTGQYLATKTDAHETEHHSNSGDFVPSCPTDAGQFGNTSSRPFIPIVSDIPLPINVMSSAPKIMSSREYRDKREIEANNNDSETTLVKESESSSRCKDSTMQSMQNRFDTSAEQICNKKYSVSDNPASINCLQNTANDPSVSFIQTLSRQHYLSTEYFIRIHVEILEAKDLVSARMTDDGRAMPPTYVKATFFGKNLTTGISDPTSCPVWNFATDIVVSSFEISDVSSSMIVLRVYERRQESGNPLIGCLALQPPTPFWPGQVSLCGWYPLLNMRGRLAGHVKLSLTIVESLLSDAGSSSGADSTPRRTDHPELPDQPAAVRDVSKSDRDFENDTCSDYQGTSRLTNDRLQTQPERHSKVTSINTRYKSVNSEMPHPSCIMKFDCRTKNQGSNDSTQYFRNQYSEVDSSEPEAISGKNYIPIVETQADPIYPPPASYADHQYDEENIGVVSETSNWTPKVARYMDSLPYDADGITISLTNDDLRFKESISDPDYISDLERVSARRNGSRHSNTFMASGQSVGSSRNTLASLSLVSKSQYPANYSNSTHTFTSMDFTATVVLPSGICYPDISDTASPGQTAVCKQRCSGLANQSVISGSQKLIFSDRLHYSSTSDHQSENFDLNFCRERDNEVMFRKIPSSPVSCLKTVDSPRMLSKKVQFADDPDFSANLVSIINSHRPDELQQRRLTDIVANEYLSDNLASNFSGRGSPVMVSRNFCESDRSRDYMNITELPKSAREPEKVNNSNVSERTVRINPLLESLSWMNLARDNDSPCVSYIDSSKRSSLRSREERVLASSCPVMNSDEEIVTPTFENNAFMHKDQSPTSSKLVVQNTQDLFREKGDAGRSECCSVSSDTSKKCSILPDYSSQESENQSSLFQKPQSTGVLHPTQARQNVSKCRLAANFSFKKQPR